MTSVLIESNQGLVHNIASKFVNHGLAFDDLVQEGNIGLLRAIELFDVTKNTQFGTYATLWIRQGIMRAIADTSRTIRVPAYVHDRMIKMSRLSRSIDNDRELALAMDLSSDELNDLQSSARGTISLHSTIGGEEGFTLADTISDNAPTPQEAAEDSELGRVLSTLMKTLKDREAKILTLRYGLGGCAEHTLGEIAVMFEISHERVRQIESSALWKLNRSDDGMLKDFLRR